MPSVEYRGMNLVIPENDSEWREHFKLARTTHRLMLRACRGCDWSSWATASCEAIWSVWSGSGAGSRT